MKQEGFQVVNENTLRFTGEVFIWTNSIKATLRHLALSSGKGSSRICLHLSERDSTQSMIIYLLENTYFRRHVHPKGCSESYTIIDGELKVDIFGVFNEDSPRTVTLNKDSPIYMHSGGVVHRPYTESIPCTYHEIYHSSFIKERDVVYV